MAGSGSGGSIGPRRTPLRTQCADMYTSVDEEEGGLGHVMGSSGTARKDLYPLPPHLPTARLGIPHPIGTALLCFVNFPFSPLLHYRCLRVRLLRAGAFGPRALSVPSFYFLLFSFWAATPTTAAGGMARGGEKPPMRRLCPQVQRCRWWMWASECGSDVGDMPLTRSGVDCRGPAPLS